MLGQTITSWGGGAKGTKAALVGVKVEVLHSGTEAEAENSGSGITIVLYAEGLISLNYR